VYLSKQRRSNQSKYTRQDEWPGAANIVGGWMKTFMPIFLLAIAGLLGYFGASLYFQAKDLPDIATLEHYDPIQAIQIFDRYDHLVCLVEGDENRQMVPLGEIAIVMQRSMLAAEDHHFFEHHGINVMSIMRAIMANVQAGHVVEGGSTITQQLVKNLFFAESGRTYNRKLKEALLAFAIEQRYSKAKILELYLNQIYFGSNAYGIERAAARYFNKSALKLNLAEAAFLAGLVKAPSELGNPNNRAQAIARQHEILDKMVEYGYVTKNQKAAALKTKLVFRNGANPFSHYPYYISYVLQVLHEKYSENELRKQGLKIYTNLDPKVETIAENTLSEAIKHTPKGVSQAALVSISVADGAVLALVGGVGDFWKNQFNRATNPHTVGSSFKPFVYLTAFLEGLATPDTTIDDSPLVVHQGWGLPDYIPKNFDHKFYGRITVRKALALSRNIPALRMAQKVGINNVVETARQAGVRSKLDPNLSLALGSSAVSPLDMAGAYSTFARNGVVIKPSVIRRIESNKGQVLEISNEPKTRVFPPEPVAELIDVLQDVVKYGTGTQAKLADRPVAGKTGTADEGKDIWFIGFTPDLVTAVWGGNDENLPISGHNVTGGVVMAKIWQQYAQAYYKTFPTPPGSFVTYDKKLAQLKYNNMAQKQIKENPATEAINQVKEATADFLQPKVEKIDESKEPPVVETITTEIKPEPKSATRLIPEQPNTQTYKPIVEPTVESIAPAPAPASSETRLKGKAPTAILAPNIVPSTAPTLSVQTATMAPALPPAPMPAPSRGLTAASDRLIPSTMEHQSSVTSTNRLYPYQQKSNFKPVQ
jgi:1A family penicillin-binding protein